MIAGIDGCPGAWFAITQNGQTGELDSQLVSDLRAFTDQHERWEAITIDIPIGLVESGSRQCDIEARTLLGPRKSSVFPAPLRPALMGETRAAAHDISMAIHGKGVGAQSFGIYAKVKEIDQLLLDHPDYRYTLHEIHPELSFYEWNDQTPMAHPKRSGQGFLERWALIEDTYDPGDFDKIRSKHPRSKVHDDDILDAFAALWTARRISAGCSIRCPNPPILDSEGIPMVMWR